MSRLKVIFIVSAGLICAFLATAFWLTATSFGLTAGDYVNQQQIKVQDPNWKLAANVATLGFIIFEIAATWTLIRIPLGANSSRIRRWVKAVIVLVALCFVSYAMTFAAVWGFAPDPLLNTSRTLAAWIMKMLG